MKQNSENLMFLGMAVAGLIWISSTPGSAQQSSVSVYGGALSVSDGFEDRSFVGAFIDHYSVAGLGTHGEVSFVSREEEATFFAGGLSYGTSESLRPRIMVGTSSSNQNILPEFYLRGALEIQTAPSEGLLATPAVTFRSYRNGVEEIVPGLDVAYYLPPISGQTYGVIQVIGSIAFVSPGDNVGFEVGAEGPRVARLGGEPLVSGQGGCGQAGQQEGGQVRGEQAGVCASHGSLPFMTRCAREGSPF